MDRVLGVFAKEPRPGQVKTRLATVFGAEPAAQLYEAFLRDFLPLLEGLSVRRVLAYTPESGRAFFHQFVGDRFEVEEQIGAGLGERMRSFFERRFADGTRQVVLVGSDTPDLPVARIEQAFAELERREIVLGPCDDGGYYLIGTNRLIPELFTGIDWSTRGVFMQTVRRISKLAVRLAVLEPWYDIDRAEDLSMLSARIGADRRSGQNSSLRHTEAALRALVRI